MSEQSTPCPMCSKPLRDLERVVSTHTPASVPEHAKGYSQIRRFTIVECADGHRFDASGGKGPMGWRNLVGPGSKPNWNYASAVGANA